MAGMAGLEPANAGVKVPCLTTWLHPNIAGSKAKGRSGRSGPSALSLYGVDDGTRTRDTRNHNPMLYQLNYIHHGFATPGVWAIRKHTSGMFPGQNTDFLIFGTPEGTRTPDPLLRRQLLYPAELQAQIGHPLLERVMGIEPTRPAWKAGILPLNYTRRCNGHYYSQTGANCQGILKNFFLFQCPFPKCVFILYHILHQDAREISQKSFVFSLRFSRYPPLFLSLSNSLK